MARFSTLVIALLIASPALYSALVTHELDLTSALLRYLIAVPVAALMMWIVRAVTQDYGQEDQKEKDPTVRAEAITGEPLARRSTDQPADASTKAGSEIQQT